MSVTSVKKNYEASKHMIQGCNSILVSGIFWLENDSYRTGKISYCCNPSILPLEVQSPECPCFLPCSLWVR